MHPGLCSACGYTNLPGEVYCQKCGVLLAPVPSLPPPLPVPVPVGERRAAAPAPAAAEESPPADRPASGMRSGWLVALESGRSFSLAAGGPEISIGRSDPVKNLFPDIDLAGAGGDEAGVSRLHARLLIQAGSLKIEDLNSTNFTFLNGQRLLPGRGYTVVDGDEIQLGQLKLVYRESR